MQGFAQRTNAYAHGMGIVLSFCSMICFGSNILLSRLAMARMPIELGFFIVLIVNIVFAGTLFGVELLLRDSKFVWQWKEAGLFALAGLIGTYLARRLLFDTVSLLGPARASVVHSSAPAFTLVAAWIIVGEFLGPYELGLMALVMAGLWFTQPVQKGASDAHRPSGAALKKGVVIGVLTVAGFGLSNVFRGLAMRTWNEAVFGTLIASTTALLCQFASTRDWPGAWKQIRSADRRALILYAWCGVATVCGAMFLVSAMHYIEIALATLVTHTTPLMIFPVSLIVFRNREGLSLRTAVGASMVLAGIVLLALR